jgi:hypothetical protein
MDDNPFIFEDQTFAARAKIPPPKHNDPLDAISTHDVILTQCGPEFVQFLQE